MRVRNLGALRDEPVVQRLGNGCCPSASLLQPVLAVLVSDVALHAIQLPDQFDGRLGQRALVGHVKFDELTPGVRIIRSSG